MPGIEARINESFDHETRKHVSYKETKAPGPSSASAPGHFGQSKQPSPTSGKGTGRTSIELHLTPPQTLEETPLRSP